jgi:N-acetylmuramoyl-L-alanine amidase
VHLLRSSTSGRLIAAIGRTIGPQGCFALALLALVGGWTPADAVGPAQVTALRFAEENGRTRIVLESDRALRFSARAAAEPWRLVVDLPDVLWNPQPQTSNEPQGLATSHRFAQPGNGRSQLVVAMSRAFRIAGAQRTAADVDSGMYRLVIDLEATPEELARQSVAPPIPAPRPGTSMARLGDARDGGLGPAARPAPPVIVIDAGHGGADPGAIGVNGVQEKTLTLTMARELRAAIEAGGRYRVVMTRDSDVYVGLRDRIRRAREAGGSLFISLHADALQRQGTRGASVYTLSERASDGEAARLAAKENKADIIAGADLAEHDAVVASILIDLAQRGTKNKAVSFADLVSEEMAAVTPLLRQHRRFAGFAVLKAPDIPSVLVELGYLSNPTDARNLASAGHRQRMVRSMVRAIDRYFSNAAP